MFGLARCIFKCVSLPTLRRSAGEQCPIHHLSRGYDPTGHHLLINDRRFLIVGVAENRPETIFDQNVTGTEVLIPFATAAKLQDPMFFFFVIACFLHQ